MANNLIINLTTPTDGTMAANKYYVDSVSTTLYSYLGSNYYTITQLETYLLNHYYTQTQTTALLANYQTIAAIVPSVGVVKFIIRLLAISK